MIAALAPVQAGPQQGPGPPLQPVHLDAVHLFEGEAKPLQDQPMVVGQQDSNAHVPLPTVFHLPARAAAVRG